MIATGAGIIALIFMVINMSAAGKASRLKNDADYHHRDTRVMLWLILAVLWLR